MLKDPVVASNSITHPIDLRKKYSDVVSGFEGTATGIGYTNSDGVSVILSKGDKDGKPVSINIGIARVRSVDGSRVDLSLKPELPITFLEEYEDEISGFKGLAVMIMYSSNKCVQVDLGRADKDGNPEYVFFDIQNLIPAKGVKEHNITSEKAPGAPRMLVDSRVVR